MPETSQNFFLTPRGARGARGASIQGGQLGGTVFLNSAFMLYLVIFLET